VRFPVDWCVSFGYIQSTPTGDTDMAMIWTNAQGKEITVYVAGEAEGRNGEACYRVSKVAGSGFAFLVAKSSCRPA
jgi:hypothetical protein